MKSIDQYFVDWESDVFGYGYGTGEDPIFEALKTFLEAVPESGAYDYEVLEKACGKAVTWLLINALCHADAIEYGTSPRYGWLKPQGLALRAYITQRSLDALCEVIFNGDANAICYRDHCNCEDGDCRAGNPFWSAAAGKAKA